MSWNCIFCHEELARYHTGVGDIVSVYYMYCQTCKNSLDELNKNNAMENYAASKYIVTYSEFLYSDGIFKSSESVRLQQYAITQEYHYKHTTISTLTKPMITINDINQLYSYYSAVLTIPLVDFDLATIDDAILEAYVLLS